MLSRLLLGLCLASLMGYLGYRRGSLSASGMLGAVLVGTATFGLGGWAWGVLVVVFFLTSSVLSHYKEARKAAVADKFSKGSRRDLGQVLANGGAASAIALASAMWPGEALASTWWLTWWLALVGAIATVNADTWATELGVLSPASPRLVTTGRVVPVGTSGGVTLAGTLAALAGAALIALLGASAGALSDRGLVFPDVFMPFFFAGTAGGLLGSLFDSWLGATVQALYRCERCGQETERHPLHRCGGRTQPSRGWRWLDNDWVNFISSVVGAAAAVGVYWVVR